MSTEEPKWEKCFICGERFDPEKDPNHRENCRESVRA
jgi:hypothetical protein